MTAAALPKVVDKATGKESPWLRLFITPALANSDDHIAANIEAALAMDYTPYTQIARTQKGAVSVVGSGPSLKKNWQRLLKGPKDILACNAAYQFLLGKGIVPKYMMCFDADPLMLEFITPHPDVTFLIGSRCPPKTFELLKGCKVIVWHAAGDKHIESLLQKHGKMDEPMVIGGTAAVTRSMVLAETLGYKEIHLWGCDSSFDDGETHIRQSTTKERRVMVGVAGKAFPTAPWMAQQAEDFKVLAPPLRDSFGVRFIVHGTGLIPYIARVMGFETDEPRVLHWLRIVRYKLVWLWKHL